MPETIDHVADSIASLNAEIPGEPIDLASIMESLDADAKQDDLDNLGVRPGIENDMMQSLVPSAISGFSTIDRRLRTRIRTESDFDLIEKQMRSDSIEMLGLSATPTLTEVRNALGTTIKGSHPSSNPANMAQTAEDRTIQAWHFLNATGPYATPPSGREVRAPKVERDVLRGISAPEFQEALLARPSAAIKPERPEGREGPSIRAAPPLGILDTVRRKTAAEWLTRMPLVGGYIKGTQRKQLVRDVELLRRRDELIAQYGYDDYWNFHARALAEELGYHTGPYAAADAQRRIDAAEMLQTREAQGRTLFGDITEGVINMAPYMVEMSTIPGGSKAASLAKTGFNIGVRGVAAAASVMSGRVYSRYQERRGGELDFTDEGKAILQDSQGPAEAFYKAYFSVVVMAASELAGQPIVQGIGKVAKSVPVVNTVWGFLARKLDDAAIAAGKSQGLSGVLFKGTNATLRKAKYDGLIGEIGEERLEDTLNALLGTEEFGLKGDKNTVFNRLVESIPNGRDLLVETGTLAIPGIARAAVGATAALQIKQEIPLRGKEPWELTQAEFRKTVLDKSASEIENMDKWLGAHRRSIEEALQEGEPVSEEVLADFPSLARQPEPLPEPPEPTEVPLSAETLEKAPAELPEVAPVEGAPEQPVEPQVPVEVAATPPIEPDMAVPVVAGPQTPTPDPITGVDLAPLTNPGPLVRTTLRDSGSMWTVFASLDSEVRRVLIEHREEIANMDVKAAERVNEMFRGTTTAERRAMQLSIDNPVKYSPENLPAHLNPIVLQILADNDESLAIQQEAGKLTNGGWPGGRIRWEEKDIADLQKQRAKFIAEDAPAIVISEIDDQIQRRRDVIKELENLGYVHRITRQPGLARKIFNRVIGRRRARMISARPPTLSKERKYFTVDEAEETGLEVADMAVSHGDMLQQMWTAKANRNLIQAINSNPQLSMPEGEAPSDWVRIDPRIMPAAHGRAYSPAIGDAIKELTWTGDKFKLVVWYDKLNNAMKLINFYNPAIMIKNDLYQGWRAGGLKFFIRIPRATKIWLQHWRKKGPGFQTYENLRKAGVFNRVFGHEAAATEMIQDMLDQIELSFGQKTRKWLARYFNPLHPIESLQRLNTKTTWNADEVLRIAAWDAIHDGRFATEFNMTEFELAELTNDFMASYGKVPKQTRKWLNRFFFTPTYRISMKRMLFKMYASPKKFWPQLVRHYGYKLFFWYIMPKLIGLMITGRGTDARPERGYRIAVRDPKNPGREIVFSFSDPLLEEAKLLGQPLPDYTLYQLSAGLNALFAFTARGKRPGADPFGGIFKLGPPFWRDIELIASEDHSRAEKIIQALGIAYVYKRRKQPGDDKNALEQFGIATSLWIDWKEQKEALAVPFPVIEFKDWWKNFKKNLKGK